MIVALGLFFLLIAALDCFWFKRISEPNSNTIWIGNALYGSIAANEVDFSRGYTCSLFGYYFGVPLIAFAYKLKSIDPSNIDVTDLKYKYRKVYLKCSKGWKTVYISKIFSFEKVINSDEFSVRVHIDRHNTILEVDPVDYISRLTIISLHGKELNRFNLPDDRRLNIQIGIDDFKFDDLIEVRRFNVLSRKSTGHVLYKDTWLDLFLKEFYRVRDPKYRYKFLMFEDKSRTKFISFVKDRSETIRVFQQLVLVSSKIGDLKTIEDIVRFSHTLNQTSWNMTSILEARSKFLSSPLHIAALHGNVDVVKYLIGHHFNVNARNVDNLTPLHYASKRGDLNITKILLDHGASVEAKSNNGYTPLHLASRFGQTEVVDVLIDHNAEVDAVDEFARTSLHYAAWKGYNEIVNLLLKDGATVNFKDIDGSTPLHLAIQYAPVQVFKLLLKNQADVNAANIKLWTPLHLAAWRGEEEVFNLVLNYGTNIEAKTEDGSTALHLSSQLGRANFVRTLIQKKADTNSLNVDKWTPLHSAAWGGNREVAKLIMKHGAKIEARTKYGNLSYEIARSRGHEELAKYLFKHLEKNKR